MNTQIVNPSVSNFVKSLRDIGYTFEIAVADIIDNSITANSSIIKIYTVAEPKLVFGMLDDGKGMSNKELVEAMRLATKDPDIERDKNDLGRFGLGLKTASFSQCKKLTVLSKKNGIISIGQWDIDYLIKNNKWLLKRPSFKAIGNIPLIDELKNQDHGTLVIWEELDRYEQDSYSQTIEKLRKHLSLVFHRYLEGAVRGRKIRIIINNNELSSFNPFNISNHATQELGSEKVKYYNHTILIQPFILPHHSKVSQQEYEQYATEEGYTKSQGFYLYRENRLLIYGTWWGLHRTKDAHKLVRIKIDISNKQDYFWGIDIKKSTANPCQEIKSDLKRIINQITEKGSRPFTGRGRKIEDKTTTRFWKLVPYNEGIRFMLNEDHPILDKLIMQLSDEQNELLEIYLRGLQSYLPLEAIQAQLQENPHKMNQEQSLSDEELISLIKRIRASGADESYIEELLKTELFKNKGGYLKMLMSSYEKVKDFIYKKLQEVDGVLPKDKIRSEVENTKTLMESIGIQMFAKVLSADSLTELLDNDWNMMQRELETLFDVEMENGILIQGEDQQKRDTIWWTSKGKQKSEGYYWNRYKKYIRKSLPFEVVKTMDVDTDKIMDNIEDPQLDDFSIYGMVVGHVQSGKTGNYSALICKAADAGYKFIVVIAGGTNNLRDQTQDRLNRSFVGVDLGTPVGVGKMGGIKKKYLPVSLTTKLQDFNKRDADKFKQGINFDNINSPIMLVIKKHGGTLDNVIGWLEDQYSNQKIANHAMLLIDDESDYASINTKEEDNPAIINGKIRKLLSLFKKSTYVAYTATPYANIFIDHQASNDNLGKDLFPKDFIYALGVPSNYFGARKIFLDTGFKHIVEIEEPKSIPLNHKKEIDLKYIPDSLKDAIRVFIINIGIRCLRNQTSKHNSMLIHATRFTMVHQKISLCVEEYVSVIRKDIISYALLDTAEAQSKNIREIKETFELICRDVEFPWEKVLKSINDIIETIVIREVHQNKSIELEYRDDRVTNAIVIGGTSLSRGFTLEGLSVSYFLRSTIFYDTLMQMGRWFGYRENYEDLCRIYMTKNMRNNFKIIIEATEDLFDNFKRMEKEKMTPEEFGLAVRQHPDSGLQVTARNKQKNSKEIYFEMKLDGSAKETSWLIDDSNVKRKNIAAIKNTIYTLEKGYHKSNVNGKDHLWKNVDKEIVKAFLQEFEVYRNDPFGIKSRMPIDFIKKYVEDIDTNWDIALYSGSKGNYPITDHIEIYREERQVEQKEGYYEILNRQVSSGNAESISLPEMDRKGLASKRKDIRQRLERPLLMLHILDVVVDNELAAFGISFPGGISSCGKTVVLKINSVYVENLLKEEEYDD